MAESAYRGGEDSGGHGGGKGRKEGRVECCGNIVGFGISDGGCLTLRRDWI